ncbi:MAG: carboxyl transferase domain-containing protein [Candidatus Saccharimonadales bacterium]|jgi:acetyl-CoA carboxylase carboxyl transferase subunit beta
MSAEQPGYEGDDDFAAAMGEWSGLDLRPAPPPLSTIAQLTAETPPMRGEAISQTHDELLRAMNFRERYADSKIESDLIGLVRRLPDGSLERYNNKLAQEARKGKNESAAFGLGKIGDQDVVIYAMEWKFFAGSFGVVAGEKYQLAMDLAIRRKLPVVSIISSSGVRQQENTAGLWQMSRSIHNQDRHKTKTTQPHIVIENGQVWGGLSASIVPQADVITALKGTEYGFTGPKVIEAYEGKPVEPGAQRAEAHLVNRNVDVILDDVSQTLAYVGQLLRVAKAEKTPRKQPGPAHSGIVAATEADLHDLDLGTPGILSPWFKRAPVPVTTTKRRRRKSETTAPDEDDLYREYQEFIRSGTRPDTAFFMREIFDEVVPLFNGYVADKILHYPAIIASVGRVGLQRYLAIGSQPSYQESYDGLRRIPASPDPSDYQYLVRMLNLGERWKIPAVYFADTLGAKPTLDSEKDNQMYWISEAIRRADKYSQPLSTFVIGALGSGGGLSVASFGDRFMMLANSQSYVAEPGSATSILYKTGTPAVEDVKLTLATMSATPEDQVRLELCDEIIGESDDPRATAIFVRDALVRSHDSVRSLTARQLLARRDKRARGLGQAMLRA